MADRQQAGRHHGGRWRWTVALAASIGLVALWLGPAAQAATCNTSGGGANLNITIAAGQTVSVRINASNVILVDGGGLSDDNCGGNNAGTVTVINVDGSTGNETFRIDDSGGGGPFDNDDDFDIDLSSGTDILTITGDSVADTITFTPLEVNGSDIAQTGVETFSAFSGNGDDIVNGGTFSAGITIGGGAGTDQLTGGNGNDSLNPGDGNDVVNGGVGTDTVTYSSTVGGVTVNLGTATAQNTGGSGTDTIVSVENLTGTSVNDSLTGSATANAIAGGSGDDLLVGGDGDDSLNGGDGADAVSYASSAGPVSVNLSLGGGQNTGAGTDVISNVENAIGGSGGDTLNGNTGANVLTGGAGNDTLAGGDGDDRLDGGDGRDRVTYASAVAPITVNLSTGTAGGQGSDLLTGIENVTGSAARRHHHRERRRECHQGRSRRRHDRRRWRERSDRGG